MAGCDHKSCGGSEKVWLPYFYRGRERGLKPHPFCADCGLVKNLSSERPRDVGYYMNVLSVLGQRYKVVQVQKHLVAMEMERLALDDGYGMDRKMQEKLFVEIVTRILNVPERAVTVILEAP
jgi:hypothetical protein